MKNIGLIMVSLMLLLAGCVQDQKRGAEAVKPDNISAGNDSIKFNADIYKSDIEGLDSIMLITANGKELFKIALGGNMELLKDTVLSNGSVTTGIITLADYFQNDQILYVIYSPDDSVLYQSERLYLPGIGMTIQDYRSLDFMKISGDSLFLSSGTHPEISISLEVDTLRCNKDGIINYYEFE